MSALPKELSQLGVHEKLQLVEDLWDSIDQDLMPPMSEELKAELDRRWAWVQAHPGTACTPAELAASLGVRL